MGSLLFLRANSKIHTSEKREKTVEVKLDTERGCDWKWRYCK